MSLALSFALLILGLGLLWKSGDWSVTNAIRFSVAYETESFAIGFFLFAISTGLPEITSAIVSSFEKVPELSAGNLVGSTFVNLSLQLGIAAIIAKQLPVENSLRSRLLQTAALVTIIVTTLLFFSKSNPYLGGALVATYILSFIWFSNASRRSFKEEVKKEKKESISKIKVLVQLALSLGILMLSAWLTVNSAISIAKQLNVPVALIGGTIIAVGTALPELTLEIHAVRKKEYGLALGDIFGSSLLNVSFVLGMLLLLNPGLTFIIPRIISPFFAVVLFWIFFRFLRKKPFTRLDGIAFVFIFTLYIARVSLFFVQR